MQLTLGYPHLQDPKLPRLNHLHRSILTTAHHRAVFKTSICQGKDISISNNVLQIISALKIECFISRRVWVGSYNANNLYRVAKILCISHILCVILCNIK